MTSRRTVLPFLPFWLLLLAVPSLPATLHAQDSSSTALLGGGAGSADEGDARAVLTPEEYGRWEELESPSLSADGRWLHYRVRAGEGEAQLHVRLLGTDSIIAVPRGSGAEFSPDGRWLAFTFALSDEERERLEADGSSARRALGLVDTRSGERTDTRGVTSFRFSADSRFLATRRSTPRGNAVRGGDVVVRDLEGGSSISFGNVAEFEWAPEGGALLALVVDAEERVGNGVRLYDAHEGRIRPLVSEESVFRGLTWREGRPDLAVFEVLNGGDPESPEHAVRVWRGVDREDPPGLRLVPEEAQGFPGGARISADQPLRWARTGEGIFVGLSGPFDANPEEPSDGAGGEEEAEAEAAGGESGAPSGDEDGPPEVEIWHARDVRPVPQQKVQSVWDERSTAVAVWWLDDDRFVPLQEASSGQVDLAAEDRLAIGLDERPYERERMFGPLYRDVYAIDPVTGAREKIRERVEHFFGASPGGRYVLYLDRDDFWAYDREDGEHRNLTAGLPTSFVDLEDDHTVAQKPPFGHAGWTVDDEWVLLYDRYDVWKVAPDGSGGVRLTDGEGAQVSYRYVFLDGYDDWIDLERPLYLFMNGERSKRSGYARLDPGEAAPEALVWMDRRVSRLARAESADVYAFVVEGFDQPPNVHVGGPDLRDARQVTELNAFQSEYLWGSATLLEYENRWGEPLQAALFYPADFVQGRKYPMIVFPYERRSGLIHRYEVPTEREPYNTTVWTQRGYFVLAPDITYRPRNPGLSALAALEPAVDAAVATGLVDPEHVGLIGHSWGGYQTAFVLTQSDRFAAGVAGAPLTNLISMYLSFFWNTGDPDARIFETSQARMEVPWWQDYDAYVANSPVHHIESLNTPLLMAFGTEDGAVDFHQGVEFYNAARRAGKDLVFLVYEGEGHSLTRRPNRIDLHRRILEWFDHYLKGADAPAWITEGVPYVDQRNGAGRAGGGR